MRFPGRFSVVILVFAFSISSAKAAVVLTGPIINPSNGHAYYMLTQDTWTNSETAAQLLGGTLAVINDATEQAWVFNTFEDFGGTDRNLWIGLSDPSQDALGGSHSANFQWADGSGAAYRDWASGEPNNQSGFGEFYVYMWKAHVVSNSSIRSPGTWNDVANNPYSGIYGNEPDVAVVNGVVEVAPEPTSISLLLGGMLSCGIRRKREYRKLLHEAEYS